MPTKRPPSKLIAVDWDAHNVRIVHAFISKRGIKIDRLLAAAIPADVDPADPARMGKHLRRVLDQERITTRHATVDIPRDQAILKTLHLPAIRPEELAGVVEIQIAKELPFPAGEGVIDFVPGATAADTMDVSVAVARREIVQQCEAVFREAGLKLDRIGLRPFANRIAVADLLKFAPPERVLFMDVRPSLTEIDVFRGGSLAFSRAASVPIPKESGTAGKKSAAPGLSFVPAASGSDDELAGETRAADAPDRIITTLLLEVTRSLEAYRAHDAGAQMDHAVIAGDTGVEESLAEAIQKRLGITTELYNPANSFGMAADEGAAASAFSAALGLVLSQADPNADHFNFLDPKRVISQTKERLRKAPIAAAVAILFVSAAGIAFASYTRPKRNLLARINEEIKGIEEQKADYEKFLTFVDVVRRFDAEQHVWVDVVYEVMAALPQNDELVLTHLDMDQKEGRVTLKTKAVERDTATKVVNSLREYRREGRGKPRFEASAGPQTERKGESYPFTQDFKITVLDDSDAPKKTKDKS